MINEDLELIKKELEAIKRDAARYRFLRDEDNWGEDSGGDSWEALTNSQGVEFDKIVDSRMEKLMIEVKS